METLVIAILVGIVFWVIGLFCGMASPSHSGSCLTGHDLCHHWDYDIKSSKISSLERSIFLLEQENQSFRPYPRYYVGCDFGYEKDTARYHYVTFRGKSPEEQKIADLMQNTMVSVEDLAQKLGIEITK